MQARMLVRLLGSADAALVRAANACRWHVVRALLGRHSYKDNESYCAAALRMAASDGQAEVCHLLLAYHEAHADANNSLALIMAAQSGHIDVCKLLLSDPRHPARADTWYSWRWYRPPRTVTSTCASCCFQTLVTRPTPTPETACYMPPGWGTPTCAGS